MIFYFLTGARQVGPLLGGVLQQNLRPAAPRSRASRLHGDSDVRAVLARGGLREAEPEEQALPDGEGRGSEGEGVRTFFFRLGT